MVLSVNGAHPGAGGRLRTFGVFAAGMHQDPSPNSGWRSAYAARCPDGGAELVAWVAKHKPPLRDPIHPTAARIHGAANSLLLIWLEWRFAACPLFLSRVSANRWGTHKQNRQLSKWSKPGYKLTDLKDKG